MATVPPPRAESQGAVDRSQTVRPEKNNNPPAKPEIKKATEVAKSRFGWFFPTLFIAVVSVTIAITYKCCPRYLDGGAQAFIDMCVKTCKKSLGKSLGL